MPSQEKQTNGVVAKLAKVMGGLGRVEKRGRNEFHKYDYVMEADLADAVREDLAKAGVIAIPQVIQGSEKWIETEKGHIFYANFLFTFTDGVDSISVIAPGCGSDNPGDKAPYKAFTGAEKYALMKLFLIATGDDPENEHEDPGVAKHASRPSNPTPSGSGSVSRGTRLDYTLPFGSSKGKKLSELTDKDLGWYTKIFEENVEKNDPKWHIKNVEALEAARAEWARRVPWKKVWNDCVALATKAGLGEAALIDLMKEVTGKSKASELVSTDYETLKAKIEEIEREIDNRP